MAVAHEGNPALADAVEATGAGEVGHVLAIGDGFALHAKAILDAVTPRTRGIIINS